MDDLNNCPSSQEFQEKFTPANIVSDHLSPNACGSNSTQDFHSLSYYQKPVKKRARWMKIENENGVRSSGGGGVAKLKKRYTKKPDPSAPKITPPCTVCGKKFWSWKALFGHMRCHPERRWRGINPPSNLSVSGVNNQSDSSESTRHRQFKMSLKDHEAAGWLLMLANSPTAASDSPSITTVCHAIDSKKVARSPPTADGVCPSGGLSGRFECSSCKKVFGTHQALGGHRASHRNVKGCFANAKNDDNEKEVRTETERESDEPYEVREQALEDRVVRAYGHQCGICFRVFASGQALGGHKRCRWENRDEPLALGQALIPVPTKEGCCWDLNFPAPLDDVSSCSYSPGLALDLRLGI